MALNTELSKVFGLMADILEIQGENRFRINSYRRASRTMKDLHADLRELVEQSAVDSLPGVGKGIAEKIHEFLETGKIADCERLLQKIPEGLTGLLNVPGLGPKKVAVLWKQLDIQSLDDLKRAIESKEIEELPGFGAQSVTKIAEGIGFLERSGGRTPLGRAFSVAERIAHTLQEMTGVEQVAIAGSLRRGRETIGDIDLLCTAQSGAAVIDGFVNMPEVSSVLAAGETKGSITVPLDNTRDVQVDLRVVPGESFGAAMQYFTGSKQHNVRLRERAIKRGLKLNEWGLFDGQEQIAGSSEDGIYRALDLDPIPPELREDRGEFDCNGKLFQDLVVPSDIKGDLHMHTLASDGKCSIEEMARAAAALGYDYINITDHSKSSAIANGLSVDRMMEHIQEIREVDAQIAQIRILVGCECDILSDGRLDYPDDVLAACDIVVASVHVALGQDRQTITKRVVAAVENPHVHILGHPTGRILNKRPAGDLDMETVAKSAAAAGTALEINASWKRLDLKDQHVRVALENGAMLAINTDSHHTDQLLQMRYGIATARRGWAIRERVINTFDLASLIAWKNEQNPRPNKTSK